MQNEKYIKTYMEISKAYIKQMAAIGYNKQELCRKLNMTMFFFIANYMDAYREGQKMYVEKVKQEYKKYHG